MVRWGCKILAELLDKVFKCKIHDNTKADLQKKMLIIILTPWTIRSLGPTFSPGATRLPLDSLREFARLQI